MRRRENLVVRKAGERAGIEWNVGLHALRQSCGTIMYRRGVAKEQLRKMLGYHSWEFTADTYVHLNDDDLPDGDVLADLLGGKTVPADGDEATMMTVASER